MKPKYRTLATLAGGAAFASVIFGSIVGFMLQSVGALLVGLIFFCLLAIVSLAFFDLDEFGYVFPRGWFSW